MSSKLYKILPNAILSNSMFSLFDETMLSVATAISSCSGMIDLEQDAANKAWANDLFKWLFFQ